MTATQMDALCCETLDSKGFEDAVAKLRFRKLDRVPHGELDAGNVRIAVQSAALNFYELLSFLGKYQVPMEPPFPAGSEGAGVVLQVGEGDNLGGLKVGDRVMFMGGDRGAMADEAIVSSTFVLRLPDSWSFDEGAGFSVGFITGYHGLIQRGKLSKGETVLVTGAAGGMGLSAIQIARHAQAGKIIACVSSKEKGDACLAAGATHVVNYADGNLRDELREITDGAGVDVAYDVVGGAIFEKIARSMAGGGRLLVIGFTSGEIPKLAVNLALVKGFSVVGVRSGFEMVADDSVGAEMREFLTTEAGARLDSLKPVVSKIYSREQAREAYERMAARQAIGKLVVRWQSTAKANL